MFPFFPFFILLSLTNVGAVMVVFAHTQQVEDSRQLLRLLEFEL